MGRKAANVAPFNDLAVKRIIKGAVGKAQQEWRFEGVQRLVMVTRPTGSATFYVFYVNRHKERRKLRLGDYDADHFPLTKARSLALEHISAIDQGADPVGDNAAKAKEITFQALAEQCLSEHPDLAETTKVGYRHALKRDAYPKIGHLPASDVTTDHIVEICKAIEAKGARVQADRTKAAIGGVYRWAMRQRLVRSNPTKGIGRRASNIARTRTPTDAELAAIWEAICASSSAERDCDLAARSVALIMQLAIVTGQRRTEVAGARLSELQGLDTVSPVWVISGDVNKRGKIIQGRTKNGREQRVPLSWQAVELFRNAIEVAQQRRTHEAVVHRKRSVEAGIDPPPSSSADWLFPADAMRIRLGKVPRTQHINGESVTRALIALRSSIDVKGVDVSDISLHDMRRAISNWLKDKGVSREVRDLVLNHLDPSVTERHYSQLARMETQVRAALQAWADHVWKITGQAWPIDNVVALRA